MDFNTNTIEDVENFYMGGHRGCMKSLPKSFGQNGLSVVVTRHDDGYEAAFLRDEEVLATSSSYTPSQGKRPAIFSFGSKAIKAWKHVDEARGVIYYACKWEDFGDFVPEEERTYYDDL